MYPQMGGRVRQCKNPSKPSLDGAYFIALPYVPQYFQLLKSAPFGAVRSMCSTMAGKKRCSSVEPAGPEESPAPE